MFHNMPKVIVCGRRNTFASFSEDELQLPWQVQHLGSTLETSIIILRGRRSTSGDASSCVFFANPVVRAASSQVMSTCQLRGKCGTSWESHSAKQAKHFAKIHPVWKSLLHFTLHTLHFTLHTPHCRLLYSTLYTLHSTLYTPQFSL